MTDSLKKAKVGDLVQWATGTGKHDRVLAIVIRVPTSLRKPYYHVKVWQEPEGYVLEEAWHHKLFVKLA